MCGALHRKMCRYRTLEPLPTDASVEPGLDTVSRWPGLDPQALEGLVRRALDEDLGRAGDVTSKRIVRADQPARAQIVSKSDGLIAGVPVSEAVFRAVDKATRLTWAISDGGRLEPGTIVADLSGRARALLAAERVALNFLQHLSGVATLTAEFVERCSRYGVQVLCTRKTLPGLREVQRYAVAVGGGALHRAGLHEGILIKTNHERLAGGLAEAIRRTKPYTDLEPEVEARTLEEVQEALKAGATRILLDNADLETIAHVVERTRNQAHLEVSGGITLETVEAVARLRPDAISVGRITHSAPAVDIAMSVLGPVGAAPRQR